MATASTGSEAVTWSASRCPDVAIIDISMPLMDGIETARQIRIHCNSTRILMLSIYDNPEYIQRAVGVGAQGYILKDMIGNDLLAAIRSLYKGSRYFSQKVAEVAQKFIDQKGNDSWVAQA